MSTPTEKFTISIGSSILWLIVLLHGEPDLLDAVIRLIMKWGN